MKKHLFLIALICSVFTACVRPELPIVTTNSVSEVTDTTALCVGAVVNDGNAEITAKGFCWGTEQNPTLDDNTIAAIATREAAADDFFTATLSGLTAATEYFVRAYATNSEGTAYGDNVSFVTAEANIEEPETPEEPETQYEYVDLGLPSGVKWAAYNIGATTPEGYGVHFAWGEIETKETYESSNCSSYYKDLGDISGNPEYDAATAKWGEGWRTPTLADMYELVTQCQWISTEVNGVSGFNVVSNVNGNHIFIPAAGFRSKLAEDAAGVAGVLDEGKWGYYWTTTPYSEELDGGKNTNTRACFLTFSSGGYMTDQGLRRSGFSIRPVRN